MSYIISNNIHSKKTLEKLISNNFYKGIVENDHFELKRNCFPNNLRIVGNSIDSKEFKVYVKFKTHLEIAKNILLIFGLVFSLSQIVSNNWIFFTFYSITILIAYLIFKLKSKKELDLFMNKYLEFKEIEISQ